VDPVRAADSGLYGLPIEDALRHVGSLSQVAKVESLVQTNGPANGSRLLRLTTGGGLEVDIHPDRCLDLGQVTFRGIPMAWIESKGIAGPWAQAGSEGDFLRSFGGGLLATCGLDTFGPATIVDGVHYPMHGRIGLAAAEVTTARHDEGLLVVEGIIRQSRVFGENLVLHRRIESAVGSTVLSIRDTVTNEGSSNAGHMVLYHANFGWPLVAPGSTVQLNATEHRGVDERASQEPQSWSVLSGPRHDYEERVYVHGFDGIGRGVASLENPALNIRATLSFDTESLPALFQWKMLGEHTYALGLEPANYGYMHGRAPAEGDNTLPTLAPGESITHSLRFEFGSAI
jgi:Domain of unknown function (DUF4432)